MSPKKLALILVPGKISSSYCLALLLVLCLYLTVSVSHQQQQKRSRSRDLAATTTNATATSSATSATATITTTPIPKSTSPQAPAPAPTPTNPIQKPTHHHHNETVPTGGGGQHLGGRTSNRQVPRPNRNQASARQITSRIESLDDISHRLDQTRENAPLELDDTRVPFWNIAHMINSIEQIDLALGAGSNGIETDVSFDSRGHPVEAYHGFPCDCGRHCHHREDFVEFMKHLARLTVPPASSGLFVVLLDLKLKDLKKVHQKETAGLQLAQILHEHIYAPYEAATSARMRSSPEQRALIPPPLRVVLSINHANDIPLVKAFIGYMRTRRLDFMSLHIGFDVGMNDDLAEIAAAWDGLNGATLNIWQGDGLTNCANMVRGVERLKQAISVRNGQGHFRKVYYWTADVLFHIRSVLRLGLDAILTNQPQRVVRVLNEPEFRSKYRLATQYDDPFEQFWIQPTAWKMSPPRLDETVETLANLHKTSTNFVLTLPDGISAALKKVHHSIG